VKRNKRPALTSPWKIGFLVSLLLVTVSIGVGFAITRTFAVAWSWIQVGDGSWAFDLDAFLNEMLPLVVIVPVMSLVSYFVITGAVRKYRAYLDSGQDYKHLVKSIRQIDDLQEDRIKILNDYPELRDFLLRLRKRITDREKALDELEASVNARQAELKAAEEYASEAAVLTGAIKRGPADGFAEELGLAVPEMKRVEEAIRGHLLVNTGSMALNDFGEQLSNIRSELKGSTSRLATMITELTSEIVVSQNGAREIEMFLNQLKTVVAGGAGNAASVDSGGAAQLMALVDRMDHASSALAALGEETKSIAINTALQAGQGEGGVAELVKLADSVRDVAARFNGISATYQETGQQVRAAVQAGAGGGGGAQVTETLDTMSDKVTYWVERAVILAEKLITFERQFVEVTRTIETKLGGEQPDDKYQDLDDLSAGAQEAVAPPDPAAAVGNDVPSAPAGAPAAGIAGLETNKNLFEEIGGGSDDNLFADIPPDAATHTGLTGVFERNEIHPPATEEPGPPAATEPPEVQSAEPGAHDPQAPGPERREPPVPHPPVQEPQAPAPPDPASAVEPPPTVHPHETAPVGEAGSDDGGASELFEEIGIAPLPQQEAPATPPSRTEPGEFIRSQPDLSGDTAQEPPDPDATAAAVPSPGSEPEADAQPKQTQAAPPVEDQVVYDLYELGAVDYEPTVHHSA
jgi:hypothetical protein